MVPFTKANHLQVGTLLIQNLLMITLEPSYSITQQDMQPTDSWHDWGLPIMMDMDMNSWEVSTAVNQVPFC